MNQGPNRIGIAGMLLCFALAALYASTAIAQEGEPITLDQYFELGDVRDPRISPDGEWIVYTVTRDDLEEDTSSTRIWRIPAAGGEPVAVTAEGESSSSPRWSPDGRWLAFLSARDEGPTQVWLLDREGGEAVQLTDTPQSVEAYEWSPDGRRVSLVLQDPKPEELAAKEQGEDYEEKTPGPWVVDREQFKTDYVGYLDRRRTHIYVLDVESREMAQLTDGDYDDFDPAWSPDGERIAFVSNRTEKPDLSYNTDIWTVSTTPPEEGTPPLERVTTNPGADNSPAWSPDGKWITHTVITHPETSLYSTQHLAVTLAAAGDTRVLTAELDRMIFRPAFGPDGEWIWFLLEDSGEQNLARIRGSGDNLQRLVRGEDVVNAFDLGANGEIALRVSRPHLPGEVFVYRDGKLEQRTFTNRDVLEGVRLGEVVEVQFDSADGTRIEGFIVKPPGFTEGERYPTILDIHGGPQSQYDYSFNFEAQLLAANGYLVVLPNPRGSTGYGREFCLAIWQDWGGPDYEDVMAAVDDAIARGWADPDLLGVMGWSYGGMLTNHVITKTERFDAAATGASATLYVVNYGHDMYIRWWEQELGFPWEAEARALYERMSPFNRVENVTTPTLILGGEKDWNVPIINSEQLYLALKRLGVETQLVVYPDEYHGGFAPSHQKDLYDRYLGWFGEHME